MLKRERIVLFYLKLIVFIVILQQIRAHDKKRYTLEEYHRRFDS